MMEILKSAFNSKLFLVATLLLLFYIYLKKVVYSYWKRHQVPYEEPSLLLGTVDKELILQKISVGDSARLSYEKFRNHPFHGLYTFLQPALMINDPDLLKSIFIKDFSCFLNRGVYDNRKIDPLSGNMFFLNDARWKNVRLMCNVFFTPKSLRNTFPILTELVKEAATAVNELIIESDIINMKDFVERFFVASIFNIAFGVDTDSIRKPENKFRYYGVLALKNSPLKVFAGFCAPYLLSILRTPFFNNEATLFFENIFTSMVKKRKLEKIKRNDFLEVLINAIENEDSSDDLNNENGAKKLTHLDAAAQAFVFFIAGFETSSATTTYALMELCLNPDIQDKLREEIDEFQKSSAKLNLENLMNLPYLDMVTNETLRKHAPLSYLNRICNENYKIPNSNYIIPKGMRIMISISGIHHNPDYYPEPKKFDPTRFSKENVSNRHPCTFLPFGIGPRFCIGKRLAILQLKLLLFMLLSQYDFSICDQTPISFEHEISSILQIPKDLYLRVTPRKK